MPRKLENGKYAFKGGCIGEKGTDGKYTLVAVRKNNIKKGKKKTFSSKQISTQTQTQTGGHNSNLDITVHMLREFYSKNI